MKTDQYLSPLPCNGSARDGSSFGRPEGSASGSVPATLPTFEAPTPRVRVLDPAVALTGVGVGQRVGDFELVRELGAGSFGRVYLARQLSLDRMVALKVTVEPSSEARALAALEHDHIVRVFGEDLDPGAGVYLLSMQYVPGATLRQVLEALAGGAASAWTGRDLLAAIAACAPGPVAADPAALRDRERLARCDHVEAVCWLGARLAEALGHAHRQGILHRDVKPSNILLHASGRVLLTDFNLATLRRGQGHGFGGTVAYMAPEHLDAFNPGDPTPPEAVDARSDVYSLGVVLFELLTGRRPFAPAPQGGPAVAALRALAAARRREAPSPRGLRPDVPPVLDRVVRRCLQPDPRRRYPTAEELARVLDGCRELHALNRAAPTGPLTRVARSQPVLMASVLPLLPHLVGALVVFGYTGVWVASHPARPVLEGLFGQLSLWYSAVVFPVTGGIAYFLTRPIWRTCLWLQGPADASSEDVTRVRRRALRKPFWGATLSVLGWLPGAVLLPLLVFGLAPEAAGWDVLLQYFFSFLIAGMIALTYTEFADQFLLLCVAYPLLWVDPVQPQQTARQELGPVERRLRVFQVLCALVPLTTGITLMAGLVSAGPEQRASASYQVFLILVTGLMGLGLAGSWLAVLISGWLTRVASALAGEDASAITR
jgi:serine/threonine protein kinase